MHSFKIYTHEKHHTEAVKQGWSWPASLFQPFWLLAKKLWLGFFIFATIAIFSSVILAEALNNAGVGVFDTAFDLINLIFSGTLMILFGIYGNRWRENNLIGRGFTYQRTTEDSDPTAAINMWSAREELKAEEPVNYENRAEKVVDPQSAKKVISDRFGCPGTKPDQKSSLITESDSDTNLHKLDIHA